MTRGTPKLEIIVVPDSGTGELTGLTGRMNIIIESGMEDGMQDSFDLLEQVARSL